MNRHRLGGGAVVDLLLVMAALGRRDLGSALAAYAGPLLPSSTSLEIALLRAEIHESIGRSVLTSGDVGLLVEWFQSEAGATDDGALRLLVALLPEGDFLRAQAAARLRRLEKQLR